MSGYKNILVAVDLSPESKFVLAKAHQMARPYEAEFSLVHIAEPIIVNGTVDFSGVYFESLMREARKSLVDLGTTEGIPESRLYNSLGNPAKEICNTAKMIDADLVIMGSHGKQGIARLLGSTSRGVSHAIDRDLLIVRIPND
jgi:universal stress protein A